jgi:putative ABC transport system ATP-binding protein
MNIVLNNICPSFIKTPASEIWNCKLNIPAETYVNIQAGSGTGKTSFINIMYGLLHDYTGILQLTNKQASALSRKQWSVLRQKHISIMFQDLRLFDQLTCLDNIMLKADQNAPADTDYIYTAFDKLGITHLLHKLTGICSQGEKQRVAFIRALVQPFDWILLDEPFSHLDKNNQNIMRNMLIEKCKHNKAGLILTSLHKDQALEFNRTYAL